MCLASLTEARKNGQIADTMPKQQHIEITNTLDNVKAIIWSEGFMSGVIDSPNAECLVKAMQPFMNVGFKPWAKTDVGYAELGHSSLTLTREITELECN